MVHDIRRITLSKDEVISALEGYNRMVPDFLPGGRKIADMDALDHTSVAVTMAGKDQAVPTRVVVRDAGLMKPVVRYCTENNIDCPSDGRMSMWVEEDSLSLYMMVDLEDDFTIGIETLTSSPLPRAAGHL